ncbi:MAG: hypothetical protein WDZ90_00985 [Candidatus Paceibacterota bacterium]
MDTVTILFLGIGGAVGTLVVLAIISPIFITFLVDNPKRPGKPYLFTFIEPNQAKNVILGGNLKRFLMNNGMKRFSGKPGSGPVRNSDGYWKIIKKQNPHEMEGEFKELCRFKWWNPLNWWIKYVYWSTGGFWVGFWPWQKLKMYELERYDEEIHNDTGDVVLKKKKDTSDHVRIEQFIWPISIKNIETTDKVVVDLDLRWLLRVVNPYKAYYGVDRWDHAVSNLSRDSGTTIIRTMKLNAVLNPSRGRMRDVADFIKEESVKILLRDYGIEGMELQVLNFNPQLSEEERKKFTEPWQAEQDRKGIEKRYAGEAKGRANVVKQTGEAARALGPIGHAALEAQRTIKMAKESGEGVIIFTEHGDQKLDPVILNELKKLPKPSTPERR